jgi:glutamate-1-semialdehyde 2,1-aminomutase
MSQPIDLALRTRAARVIPGGMYGHQAVGGLPEGYPQFFTRAEGPWLWDTDGNLLLDLMCAYGPQLFGYANHDIDQHKRHRVDDCRTGSRFAAQ